MLPTANQITRANGRSWDLAVAKAGLELRPGAQLGPQAERRVELARRQLGLDQVTPPAPAQPEPAATEADFEAIFGPSPTPTSDGPPAPPAERPRPEPESQDGTPAAPDADGAPSGPGRGGDARLHRSALTPAGAVAEFAKHQSAWPVGRGALDAWSEHYDVAVQRIKGGVEPLIDAATGQLAAQGRTAPERQIRVAARHLRLDLARPDGLPRRVKRYTRDDCLAAIERRYRDVPGRRKLTRAFYVSWPPGAHDAPAASQFDRHGAFAALRDEVHRKLGR